MISRLTGPALAFTLLFVTACGEPVPGFHVAYSYADPATAMEVSQVLYVLETPGSCAELMTFQRTGQTRSSCLGPATLEDDELLIPVRLAMYSSLVMAVIAFDAEKNVRATYCKEVDIPHGTEEVHADIELAPASEMIPLDLMGASNNCGYTSDFR